MSKKATIEVILEIKQGRNLIAKDRGGMWINVACWSVMDGSANRHHCLC
jgi:hypothetical protein